MKRWAFLILAITVSAGCVSSPMGVRLPSQDPSIAEVVSPTVGDLGGVLPDNALPPQSVEPQPPEAEASPPQTPPLQYPHTDYPRTEYTPPDPRQPQTPPRAVPAPRHRYHDIMAKGGIMARGKPGAEGVGDFPRPQRGMIRHMIMPKGKLPPGRSRIVNITVGTLVTTDGVNSVGLSDTSVTEKKTPTGKTYYEVTGSGEVYSTAMGVPPGTPTRSRFLTTQPIHAKYDGRTPIVVYTPPGYQVRYHAYGNDEVGEDSGDAVRR